MAVVEPDAAAERRQDRGADARRSARLGDSLGDRGGGVLESCVVRRRSGRGSRLARALADRQPDQQADDEHGGGERPGKQPQRPVAGWTGGPSALRSSIGAPVEAIGQQLLPRQDVAALHRAAAVRSR